MICIHSEPMYTRNGGDLRRVVLQSDSVPSAFPYNGESVTGLADSAVIAPGSIIYCPNQDKTFYLNEAGNYWIEKGADVDIPSVAWGQKVIELYVGDTWNTGYVATPDNLEMHTSVDDTDIATYAENEPYVVDGKIYGTGVLTAVAVGTTKLRGYADVNGNHVVDVADVIVNPAPDPFFKFTKKTYEVPVGGHGQFELDMFPKSFRYLQLTSSDYDTVGVEGLSFYGNAEGTVTITGTLIIDGVEVDSDTCIVNVVADE